MDFNKFDSVAASNKGAWMQVNSPIDGKPLFHAPDQPCRVLVYGVEGDIGQALMEKEREALKSDSAAPNEDRLIAQALPLIGGFENIHRGDAPAQAPDDVEWFLRLQRVIGGNEPTFVEQVRNFALKRANQLGNVSGG